MSETAFRAQAKCGEPQPTGHTVVCAQGFCRELVWLRYSEVRRDNVDPAISQRVGKVLLVQRVRFSVGIEQGLNNLERKRVTNLDSTIARAN